MINVLGCEKHICKNVKEFQYKKGDNLRYKLLENKIVLQVKKKLFYLNKTCLNLY